MRIFYLATLFLLLTSLGAKSQNRMAAFPDPEPGLVRFYPNPAVSYITFDFQKKFEKGYSIQIFNFLGKKVYEFVFENERSQVNLGDFYRGIYIFQLKDPTGRIVESGKFQVNK